jgi:hypothetical protein
VPRLQGTTGFFTLFGVAHRFTLLPQPIDVGQVGQVVAFAHPPGQGLGETG